MKLDSTEASKIHNVLLISKSGLLVIIAQVELEFLHYMDHRTSEYLAAMLKSFVLVPCFG